MEIRRNKKSTILCNQFSFDGWNQLLNGGPIADAILNRIIISSYLIILYRKLLENKSTKIHLKSSYKKHFQFSNSILIYFF